MINVVKRQLLFWSVVAAGAALDLISKSLVFNWLGFDWTVHKAARTEVIIEGFFNLDAALNTGTFFGQLAGRNSPLIIFTVLMMALVIIMFLAPPKEVAASGWSRLYTAALAMVLAGAAGNLWDRVACGAVRDFLAFNVGHFHWPTFNLADAWLTLGIVAYLIAAWRASRQEKTKAQPQSDGSGKTPAHDQPV